MPDMIDRINEEDRVFKTRGKEGDITFYRRSDGSWYNYDGLEYNDGYKCIGSLKLEENPAFYEVLKFGERPGPLIRKSLYEQFMGEHKPDGFTPMFLEGNIPLTVGLEESDNWIDFGNEIIDVYKMV